MLRPPSHPWRVVSIDTICLAPWPAFARCLRCALLHASHNSSQALYVSEGIACSSTSAGTGEPATPNCSALTAASFQTHDCHTTDWLVSIEHLHFVHDLLALLMHWSSAHMHILRSRCFGGTGSWPSCRQWGWWWFRRKWREPWWQCIKLSGWGQK